jgi:hypothetical protein
MYIISAASILLYKILYCFTVSSQCADSRFFILSHEATVTFNISTEDGGKLAFEVLGGHGSTS